MSEVLCGIWPGQRGLVAVVVDDDGRAQQPLLSARTDEARWALLSHLDSTIGLDYELVLPAWLARSDGIARLALERSVPLWLVPAALVEGIRIVGGLGTGPPRRTAAALARLPLATALRAHLRRVCPQDRRQLSLF